MYVSNPFSLSARVKITPKGFVPDAQLVVDNMAKSAKNVNIER
jgi:hypothetical protein